MIERNTSFGELLLFYRRRLGLTQQELAKRVSDHLGDSFHSTELSRYERNSKDRPRVEIILALIEVLNLSRTEAREFIEVAGYSPSILQWTRFDPDKYPVAEGNILERLHGSHGYWPLWELDSGGRIISANLLAFRLWNALAEGEEITDSVRKRLLGANIFDVFVRPENFSRIAMPEKSSDFWLTIIAVYKKLRDALPISTVTAFENVLDSHPVLRHLLRHAPVDIEHEWEYYLSIVPASPPPLFDEPTYYMEYKVFVERIMKERKFNGYLVTCQPIRRYTIERIKQKYDELKNVYGEEAFVQRKPDTHLIEETVKHPSFMPAIHHNKYWIVNFENTAFLRLYGIHPPDTRLFSGQPYFSWLFSDQTRELAGELTKQQLLMPLRKFVQTTQDFDQEHPVSEEYVEARNYLIRQLHQEGLDSLLAEVSQETSQPETPSRQESSACFHLDMRCPFTDAFTLSFAIVARPPSDIEEDYRIALVPTNAASKAAMMLLHLQNTPVICDNIGTIPDEQLFWLLTLLNTLRTGFTKGKGDGGWKPEIAFQEECTLLQQTMRGDSAVVKLRLQLTLAHVLLDDEERKKGMLDMLIAFTNAIAPHACEFLSTYLVSSEGQHPGSTETATSVSPDI